jgi:pheophorbide a oxygenase
VLYERGDSTSWPRQYFMPGSSDAAVIGLRKWLDTHGRALPTLPRSAADLPPQMPREVVMDRYNQHTKICPDCSAAMRGATIGAAVMAAVAAVAAGSIVAAVVAGSAPLLSGFTACAGAVSVVAAAIAAACLKLRQSFIFTDYVHAEH